ncbi:MAG: methyltransferase domain-containing protein [Candidatus Omnitrophota bacterium]|nr:methyltransferase domain-containing protein [Candidatus Omnitrophota bacterium]
MKLVIILFEALYSVPVFRHLVRRFFNYLSCIAVRRAVCEDSSFKRVWNLSLEVLPDLTNHYATVQVVDAETQMRLRLLLCAQALFMHKSFAQLIKEGNPASSWVDVGDSDGAARELFMRAFPEGKNMKTLGINFEQETVDLIRSKGLTAECMDAMDLHKKGIKYDLVSVFETLEHLPDPISFLEYIQEVVGCYLVISVPLVTASRVGLRYLTPKWEPYKKPSYANNHVFEFSPRDWCKLFNHAGWAIETEWKIRQFPRSGPLNWLMSYAWRRISFEGYWFVLLKKDHSFSERFYRI